MPRPRFREGRKTNRRWPHSIFLDVSNIDQRAVMTSRHTAAITAPFRHASVTKRPVALPPDSTRGTYARSTKARFIASRGDVASLSQMPVVHGSTAYCFSTVRIRAPDPAMHGVQAHPRGAGKRRLDEIGCDLLVAQRPESATARTMPAHRKPAVPALGSLHTGLQTNSRQRQNPLKNGRQADQRHE